VRSPASDMSFGVGTTPPSGYSFKCLPVTATTLVSLGEPVGIRPSSTVREGREGVVPGQDRRWVTRECESVREVREDSGHETARRMRGDAWRSGANGPLDQLFPGSCNDALPSGLNSETLQ
jgi:hypothetical protein